MIRFSIICAAITVIAANPLVLNNGGVWQPYGFGHQTYHQQSYNFPFWVQPYTAEEAVGFDRSGVESQPPLPLRKTLSGGPYRAKVHRYTQPYKFYRGHVEGRPTISAQPYSNLGVVNVRRLNDDDSEEAFPKTRAQVEGKPSGISVEVARKSLLRIAKPSNDYKIVCYYGGWATYRAVPMSFRPNVLDGIGCTHVIYSFAGLDAQTNKIISLDPKLDIDEDGYKNATNLRSTNDGLKVMIAIGGWNEGVKKYSDMVSSASSRKVFVDSVVEFVDKHGFDGLDLDWEYPGDTERGGKYSDRENYSLLVEDLKAAFVPKGWLLTAAVPAPAFRVDEGYDVKRLSKSLDFFNVMTYDLHGAWDKFADHHAPLHQRSNDYYPYNTLNTAYSVKHWNEKGAPKSKLVVGIPFYGRSFVLANENNNQPGPEAVSVGDGFQGQYTEEDGFVAYYEICKMIADENGWTIKKDDDGNTYAYNGKKWVGWDSPENVRRKVQFIKSEGYAGGMTWAIDLDDFNGICGEKWPLINAMKSEFESNESVPAQEESGSFEDSIIEAEEPQQSQPDRPVFNCPDSGLFPSPFSCSEFYECTPTAYLRKCPPGLLFDAKNRICNWPDQVECKVKTDSGNDLYSGNACQNLADGLYSDPSDCSRMFWCSQGIQAKLSCPMGQTFDVYSGICSFYSASRCAHGVAQQVYRAPVWPQGPLVGYFNPYSSRFQPVVKKANAKNVFCYFTNWATERQGDGKFVPENLDARLCSHIIYAYSNLDSETLEIVPSAPRVDIESGFYNRVQSTARSQNPEVKVLLGLGGWTDSSNGEKYSKLVTNEEIRRKFVKKTVKMLEIRGFDGLSFEWNFPVCWQSDCLAGKEAEREGFVTLLKELKEEFKSRKFILGSSLTGYVDKIGETAYDVAQLGEILDFANVMSYDYHGFWDSKSAHHSPIKAQDNDNHKDYNLEYAMTFYSSRGFPKSKLNAGLPFYGQSYTLSGSDHDIGAVSKGPGIPGRFTMQNGMLAFYEICSAISSNQFTKVSGDQTRGPYAYGGNQWVSFDDVETIKAKSNFIVNSDFGGAALWTVDLDDFNNVCCQGPSPLANAASEVLRGVSFNSGQIGNCQRPSAVVTPAPPPLTTTWSSGDDWNEPHQQHHQTEWTPAPSTSSPTTTSTSTAPPTPSTSPTTVETSSGLADGQFCNSESEFYSDPKDCQKYFRCVNKRIVHFSCSDGLLWSQQETACQWAAQVQCGARKNPLETRDSESVEVLTTTAEAPVAQVTDVEDVDDVTDCNDGEYAPVEGQCDAYTACSNGVLYTKFCSPGLHWVQSKLSCDWPEVSGCDPQSGSRKPKFYNAHFVGGARLPVTPNVPMSWYFGLPQFAPFIAPIYSECQTGVMTSHPKDCGSYLFCVHGKYEVFQCQAGTHWNNDQKICDHPANANCNGQSLVDESQLQGIESPSPSTTPSTTTASQWQPSSTESQEWDNGQWSDNGQWDWKPGPSTTTETTFIETSNVKEPLSGDYKVVCYFTNWAWYRPGQGKYTPNDIDPTICTHIVYGFAVLDYSNLIIKPHDSWADLDNEFYVKVTALKKLGKKVTVAIGGWNDSAGDKYSRLVNNPSARRKFVEHVVAFIEEHNFDGLDLDWEYPSCWQVDCKDEHRSDKDGFSALVRELSEAFKPKNLLLSAAVSPSKKVIDYAYDVPVLADNLDWIAVMTYDYHGHWDKKTGHVAPMYHHPDDDYDYFNTNFTMHYWIEKGAPRHKLVMGMPLYGQAFTLDSQSNNGLNAPATQKGHEGQFTRQAGFLAYYEICSKLKSGWTVVQDPEQRLGPYAYNGNQWVSFDDMEMIRYKSQYIRDMDLGGGMVWALDLDDFKNVCGQGHHPLMNTIKKVLGPPKGSQTLSDETRKQAISIETAETIEVGDAQELDLRNGFEPIEDNGLGEAQDYKVVCYFTNWANYRPNNGKFLPEDIDPSLCTHIVYGFAVLNPQTLLIKTHDSWVDIDQEFFKRVTSFKSGKRKVLLALGGWNDSQGNKYSRLVSDPEARKKFVDNAVEFLKKYDFDGLDLDWEYPKCWQVDCGAGPSSDKANFASWVKELSSAFKKEGLLLTAAVSPSAKVVAEAYDIPALSQYLDYISVMTYDYHGQWDKMTGHVAPMKEHPDDNDKTFNVEYTVKYWLDGGLDKKKLILGFPLYGQSFTLADASKNGLNSPSYGGGEAGKFTRARGFLAYYEICEKVRLGGWTVVRDSENRMGPYAYRGNQWVSFDDLDTVQLKVDFLKEQGLGGAMVWALDLDDFKGTFCNTGDTYPLLRTINRGLGRLAPGKSNIHQHLLETVSQNELPYFYSSLPASPYAIGCSGGFASHESDCGRYYQCGSQGVFEERNCASGLHWNQEKSICDWPESAGCQPTGEAPAGPVATTEATPWTPAPVSPVENEVEDATPPPDASVQETGKRVVCYFTNWSWYRPGTGKFQPDDIDASLCTHINYGFVVLDPNQLVIKTHDSWADLDNKFYERVSALKSKGPKVLVAIGGWNDSEGSKYSRLVNDASARQRFVTNALEFIERFKFDGLDLDWEYPVCWQVDCKQGPKSDKDGFSALVRELGAAFKPKGLLLTAAVSPSYKVIDEGYDVPVLNEYLDHINVMSYDYYGHWDKKTGHVSPLYNHPDAATFEFDSNFTMNYWMQKGADKSKLVMGMPMYGQAFSLNSPTPNGLGVPAGKGLAGEFTRQAGFIAYYEICSKLKNDGWQLTRDDSQPERMGPYATKGLQWVGFDDSKMIRQKSEYVRDQGFGGAMIWALDLDDFANVCGCENYPLLRTINRVLRNYSLPDPGCDLQQTAATVRSNEDDFVPSRPVYTLPWTVNVPQLTPFSNIYFPHLRTVVY